MECYNEIKCAIFFISHTYVRVIFYIAHLGVRCEIYTLALPFDLRCQSGIYIYIKTHDSESRGQEEAAVRDERVSYLQVAPLKNSQTL